MEILSVASYSALFLTLLYAIVVCSFIRGWHRLIPFKYTDAQPQIPVSVIVAARNEAENISATIEDLLAQDYDSNLLEIIFIDDHSTDNTGEIINSYADRGVRLITLNEQKALNSYKKKAIQDKAVELGYLKEGVRP